MPELRGKLLEHEPLSRHTTWRVGGPARRLYRPADADDLVEFLRRLDPLEPLYWLGLGSNLLVPDAGFPGTVIQTLGGLSQLDRRGPTGLYAQAGTTCAKVARFAARHDLVGVEFLAGIPGTLGGALAMNAGAWGGETWTSVRQIRSIDRTGQIRSRTPADFQIGYREVRGTPGEWFLDAELQLAPGDGAAGLTRIRALLDQRARTQPTGAPSCGSVFRNPPGDYAARLIEAIGLKGFRIGGAQVSEQHANFIINTGVAKAQDIAELVRHIRQQVAHHTGIQLQPEFKSIEDF